MTATRPVMTNSHVQNLPHILMITGGGVTAADYVEGRGLAGAVRADETVDCALVHVQVEAVDGDDAAKSANEVANLKDGRLDSRRIQHHRKRVRRGENAVHPFTFFATKASSILCATK